MNVKTLSVRCPTCSKEVLMTSEYPFRPFCCKRCQLIDLGDWAAENHRIPCEDDDPLNELWSESSEDPNK